MVVAAIGLATRGDDAPPAKAAADPVIPAVTVQDAKAAALQLGPRDQELVDIGKTGVSVHRAGGRRKVVALTFDDGPGKDTPSVLSILKQNNVPATFFVIGQNVQESPALVQQATAEGHEIGIHTWSHADLTKTAPAKQTEEIDTTANAIVNASGVPSRLFRAPYGAVNPSVISSAQKSKLLSVLWDVDTNDWQGLSSQQIVQAIMSQVKSGSIILMHDGGGDRASTVAALPSLIKELKKQGYDFSTVGDLVVSDPPTANDVSADGNGVSE